MIILFVEEQKPVHSWFWTYFRVSVGLFRAHLQKRVPHQFRATIRNHCWRLNGTDCVFVCGANVRMIFAYCVKKHWCPISSLKSFFHVTWSHTHTQKKHPLHKGLNVVMTGFCWTSSSYEPCLISGSSSFFFWTYAPILPLLPPRKSTLFFFYNSDESASPTTPNTLFSGRRRTNELLLEVFGFVRWHDTPAGLVM